MAGSVEARLARMEERQIAQYDKLDRFMDSQEELNKIFLDTRKSVDAILIKAGTAWWVIVQMGALTASVAAVVSWIVVRWKGGV